MKRDVWDPPPGGWCQDDDCKLEGLHAKHVVVQGKRGRPRTRPVITAPVLLRPRPARKKPTPVGPCTYCHGSGRTGQQDARGRRKCRRCLGTGQEYPRKLLTLSSDIDQRTSRQKPRK